MVRRRERRKIRLRCRVIAVCVAPFSLTLAAAQHGSGNDSRLKFGDEIVSCYKDTAELVLFRDVQMKGILAGGSFIRCLTKQ
jgi:hypothetical protein